MTRFRFKALFAVMAYNQHDAASDPIYWWRLQNYVWMLRLQRLSHRQAAIKSLILRIKHDPYSRPSSSS
jgi:hypothetical protein